MMEEQVPAPDQIRTSRKGDKNIYMCQDCGKGFVTVDLDDGVTSFQLSCMTPGCKGTAYSFFYNVPQQVLSKTRAAVEWFTPPLEMLALMSEAMQEHVARGGLVPRPVEEAPKPKKKPKRNWRQ